MFQIERASNNIVDKITKQLDLDNEKKEILAYGAFALLQTILSIFVIIVLGIMLNILLEALIISFAISILRKYSGGTHASSPSGCIIIGTIVTIAEALIIVCFLSQIINLNLILIIGLFTLMLAFFCIYKFAPVDNPAKPIKSQTKKNKMKRKSFIVLIIYSLIVIMNIFLFCFSGSSRFNVYSLCIYGGVLWQIFTLTKTGYLILNKVDMLLTNMLNI